MGAADNELDEDGFAVGARPICPFCSKPFSATAMGVWADAEIEQGYYPGESNLEAVPAVIDITCDGCDRLIYRKEIADARRG